MRVARGARPLAPLLGELSPQVTEGFEPYPPLRGYFPYKGKQE